MINTLYYAPNQPLRNQIHPKEFAGLLQDPKSLLWVDFSNEPDESCESILTGIFRFHPLAVDDALKQSHTPKVDDWGEYVYIVLNALTLNESNSTTLQLKELDIFLGKNFIVTHHDTPLLSIDKAKHACERDARYTSQGPDHLLYKIIDNLVAEYMPLMETIDNEIDQIEDEVLTKAAPDTLSRIFALKRTLLAMRRVISPQREVLNKLARDDFEVVDPRDRIFFRDIYDHLVRLHDLNESMRDLVSGALDTYLSVINNRMNEVMKTLTIITSFFMPLSFVAGFFGMNFFFPKDPIETWMQPSIFHLVLGIMSMLPILMFLWMKRRAWV